MAGTTPDGDLRERSVSDLLKQLSTETSTLVKQELDLAKAELQQQGKRAGLGAGFIGGGALFGLGAFGAFTAFFIAVLGLAMETWIAALIVTVVYGAIAAVLALQGKDKIQEATPPAPQTVETLKEDAEWAKTREAIRREIEQTRERMGETVEALGYKADVPTRTKEAVTGRVTSVKERITGAAGSVNESTPSGGDVKHAARKGAGVAQENPLGLAIGSVAIGFLAGMLIPSTRVENEKLGPVADQVKDQAQSTAQEALEHGKQVAQEVASTASEHAQQAVSDVKETAQQSAQEHGQQVKDSAQDSAQQTAEQVRS